MQKALDLSKVRYHLKNAGFTEIRAARGRSSILIIDGLRVAVKQATFSQKLWKFNFHVHGELDETDIDAYILLLNGLPGCSSMSLYLILPAPIGVKGIWISFSSLMRKYRDNIECWGLLKDLIEKRQSAA